MKENIVLERNPDGPYYSTNDEDCFFDWLDKIKCVKKYEGFGSSLFITIDTNLLGDNELRELIALFYRYNLDMKKLAVFDYSPFSKWFKDKDMYWYEGVFGNN